MLAAVSCAPVAATAVCVHWVLEHELEPAGQRSWQVCWPVVAKFQKQRNPDAETLLRQLEQEVWAVQEVPVAVHWVLEQLVAPTAGQTS